MPGKNQHKILYLGIGFLLGLAVMFLTVVIVFDDVLNAFKSNNKITEAQPFSMELSKNKNTDEETSSKKPLSKKITYSTQIAETEVDEPVTLDSLNDSLTNEFVDTMPEGIENEIVVKSDVLLTVRLLTPGGLKNENENTDKILDSLIDNASLDKLSKTSYKTEFWQSPINYSGYKKSGNKIVLFGIYQYNDANLKIIEDNIYLKYLNSYYLLKNTQEFLPLIPVKLSKDITGTDEEN